MDRERERESVSRYDICVYHAGIGLDLHLAHGGSFDGGVASGPPVLAVEPALMTRRR